MARKWSNLNLPGALHFVTGNFLNRVPVFVEPECCYAFVEQLRILDERWPSKLVAYVLMPDHFHLISNPRDGRIVEFAAISRVLLRRILFGALSAFNFIRLWKAIKCGRRALKLCLCGAVG